MSRPRIEDIEVPASADVDDVPGVGPDGYMTYRPPASSAPSGPAGGVLSGTYPDPGFAADMATQAELDAHITDSSDAHDASAISFSPTGTVAATDVQAAIAEVDSEKAPLASPALTGNPTAPTPAAADNDTSIATTAFVQGEIAAKAPLASPTFTGDPKAPTPSPGDNDTSVATTAFVTAAITAGGGYTDEQARDAIAAMIAAGTHTGISFSYNDGADSLSATVSGGGSTDPHPFIFQG